MQKDSGRIRGTTPSIEQAARRLRQELTPAETYLWSALSRRQLAGLKFRCQHPVGKFIVDFYCPAYKLVIEVDGATHVQQQEYDNIRTEQLQAYGYQVLRFTNEEVLRDRPTVLAAIIDAAKIRFPPELATVYTQIIESSQTVTEPPPSPQVWGNHIAQNPPALGDLGGEKNASEV